MKKLPRTLGTAVKFLIACTLGACTPYGSLCELKMDCEGGNAADTEACIIDYEAGEELAALRGCSDDLDRYLECFDTRADCDNNSFNAGNACDDELDDLNRCLN